MLVANAGITDDTLLMRMTEDQFSSVIDANLTGAFRCAKRANRAMLRARWGRMIFLGSVVGLAGQAGQINYASSKAGVIGLARSVTRELGSRSITANVVAPGFIETDMTADLSDDLRDTAKKFIPLQRLGKPEDVAAVVSFLASDDSAYVSGASSRSTAAWAWATDGLATTSESHWRTDTLMGGLLEGKTILVTGIITDARSPSTPRRPRRNRARR